MSTEDVKRPKIRKRGLFHSPNIRITCIIRNFISFKIGHFSSSCAKTKIPAMHGTVSAQCIAGTNIIKDQFAFWFISASVSGSVPK